MSFTHALRIGHKQPWNEAEIQTLARDTPQEEMSLVETELDSIQTSSTFASFSAGISQRWRNELRRIFVMFPKQQSQTITQIRMIFARVRAEQERGLHIRNFQGSNPFEMIPHSFLVDFVGTLPPETRARLAQVNRVFRDAIAAYRTTQIKRFVDNDRLMDLLPYFYCRIPVPSQPATFDAFQDEMQKALPEQLKDVQESAVLTEAERAEFVDHSPQQIACNPQLLLNLLETHHSMSLVTLIGQSKPRVFNTKATTLQSKVEVSQRWILKRQLGAIRLACIGSDGYKMTCIPKEVYSFSRLWELKFTNNAIRMIHPAIGTLTDLRSLVLCHNRLDCIPDSFRSLAYLTKLSLGGNRFRNIPMFVTELPMLISFDLSPASLRPTPLFLQQSPAQTKDSKLCTIQ
jgi:Leucine-rich repeat (LRR) protein